MLLVAKDEPEKMKLRRQLTLELLTDLGVLPEARPGSGAGVDGGVDGGVETRR